MKNINKSDFGVFLSIILMSIKSIINMSALIVLSDSADFLINILIIILLFPKIVSNKYSQSELFKIIFAGCVLLFVVLRTKEYILMSSFLIILSIRKMNLLEIIKIINISKVFTVLIHVIPFAFLYFTNSTNLVLTHASNGQER